jgi:sporulation protein YunB
MKKNKKIPPLLKKIIFIIFLAIILSYFLIKYYSQKITPTLIEYAEIQTKEIALKIISTSYNEEISTNYPTNILNITRTSDNDIELINYNTKVVSEFLKTISNNIENNLHNLETGNLEKLGLAKEDIDNISKEGIIYNIPLGVATNNTFLSNLGPQIPLKIKINNDVVASTKVNITNYGINNALLELDLIIEANIQVILPFTSKVANVVYTTPLSIELINGKIPNYYLSGLEYKNT